MKTRDNIPIHPNIKNRRSTVLFSGREIEEEKINSLFEAAKWAPSSYNDQPWRFVFTTKENKAYYNKFIDCLVPQNAEWARYAPLLILSIAKITFTRNNKPNLFAQYETGMAVGNLLNQATYLNIYVHQMAGYDKEKARKYFKIPEGYEPMTMMAAGYLGNADDFPSNLQEREKNPRLRKELREILFLNKFNN
jgi:nitroreductase